MKEYYLKILPSLLVLNWIPLTSQQGLLPNLNQAFISLLYTLTVAEQGFTQVINPTYSSANTAKAAPSTLAKPLCPNTLDIVIAIDSSESVQTVWNNIIDDAESFTRNFQVADHLTRIGIVDFSAVANVYSPLDSNNTVESAHRVLEKLRSRPQNGETWVELGLDRASEVFDTATPPRPSARKVLVMYTDGESTSRDYNSLKDLVKHQRDQEIETFVVTVTNTSYQPGLQIMASSFAHIYHMGKQVQIGQPTLSEGVCWGQNAAGGPSLNFVDPSQTQNLSPDKSKCEREREGANLVIQSKVPTLVPIFVPECEPNGKYKIIQRHEGTGFYWCVNPDTGEIINGTKTVDVLPNCPEDLPEASNTTVVNATASVPSGAIEFDKNKNNTNQNAPTPTAQVNVFKNFSQARKQGEPIIKYIPPIVLSRCQEERETASEILTKKTPSSVPVLVPECDVDGTYKRVQKDGTGYFWCVEPLRGQIINGTRKYNEEPTCPDTEANKRPLTNCEQEREDNLKKASAIPDIHIPECSVFDGLYLEIQRIWVGAKYCVNRYTGDHIKGTDTEIGKPDPICPDLSKCEKMQVEIHTHYYRNLTRPAIIRRDIPICKRNGFFEEVQSSKAIGMNWCVNKVTGTYIEGTIMFDRKPDCPGASNNAMSSYITSLAEGSQPGFLSSSYNATAAQPVNTTSQPSTISQTGHNSNGGVNRPLTNCQLQQIEKSKIQNITVHILQCSEYDGLYMEIQTSPHTGRKYCVTRYTGDYIRGTEVAPGPVNPKCPVKSKCEHEREKIHTYNYRNYDLPGFSERTILHCNQNGFYNLLQSDNKTRVNWCVDELSGEYISPSVMHFPRIPDCGKVSPPHTRCEREKAENGRKQLVSPDAFVPRCNVFNGLYADIQYMPSGWKWCVDKFTGDRIGSTDTEPGPQEPLCPELTNCENEKVDAHTYNYRNFSDNDYAERYVPGCDYNGLYAAIQSNKNSSLYWCADKITGVPINGTLRYSWQGKPTCPDGIPAACMMPKVAGPCKGTEPRIYFNPETATCETFVYGGCNGNDNNFKTLQQCETKCGSVTKCMIQKDRASNVKNGFVPSCMVDGSYQQMQHHVNGSSWCVDTETGQMIPNTLTSGNADCSRVPVLSEPKREPTCIEDNERVFGKHAYPIVGVYIPQCSEDGFYEEIQRFNTTGEMWCVHKFSGVQIEGTLMKSGGKIPNCPKHPNVDCLLPKEAGGCKGLFPRYYYDWQKNRCIRFNYGGCQGNTNNFKNFRLCERSCKDPFRTSHPVETGYATEQVDASRQRMIVEASPVAGPVLPNKANATAGPHNLTSVLEHVTPVNVMVVSSPGTPANTSAAQGNASAVISQAVTALTQNPVQNASAAPGLEQVVGQAWMVPSAKNASSVIAQAMHAPTPSNDTQTVVPGAVPLKDILTGSADAASPVKAFFSNQSVHLLTAHQQTPVNVDLYSSLSDEGEGLYMPKFGCELERDFAMAERIKYNIAGAFMPSCDQNGNYVPLQKNASSGQSWCVEVKTGNEIVGTRTQKGEPEPDCLNYVKQSAAQQGGAVLQRQEITKNDTATAPNVLSEKETLPLKEDGKPSRGSIAPLQNIIPIENVIAPLNNDSSSNYTLFRNKIAQNESISVQNEATNPPVAQPAAAPIAAQTEIAAPAPVANTEAAPVQNGTAPVVNASQIRNATAEAKEGMKDLGEAIGSLFGGLISAMIPIMNATANTSNLIGPSPNATGPQPGNTTDDSLLSKERSELNEYAVNCPYEIGVNLTKLGCVNDDQQVPRPLPVMILNETHVNTGIPTEQDDWKSFIRSLVCKCAVETKKRGWYTFGIQNYGECHSGPDEGRWNEDGEASKDMCIDEEQNTCDEKNTQACAGISKMDPGSKKLKHSNYVFMIVTDTHKEINIIHYDRRKRKRSIGSHLKRRHRRH